MPRALRMTCGILWDLESLHRLAGLKFEDSRDRGNDDSVRSCLGEGRTARRRRLLDDGSGP